MQRPVPVVRLIVLNEHGQALILRRSHTAYADGEWCLPGGKVDYLETVEDAAARELAEETALQCTGFRFLSYQDNLPIAEGAMHCISLYFECSARGEVHLSRESSEAAWIGPDDLVHYPLVFRNSEALAEYWGIDRPSTKMETGLEGEDR